MNWSQAILLGIGLVTGGIVGLAGAYAAIRARGRGKTNDSGS